MSKKPTTSFGYMSFGKEGSVRPNFETLPDSQKGQEESVALRLVKEGKDILPVEASIRMLKTDGNDFLILDNEKKAWAEVEATEIVLRDYCSEISKTDYDAGKFHTLIYRNDQKYLTVNNESMTAVLKKKVQAKLAKNYAKPKNTKFWLLIWSVTGHPIGNYVSAGNRIISQPVKELQEWLSDKPCAPFDEIILYELNCRPQRIWPAEQSLVESGLEGK